MEKIEYAECSFDRESGQILDKDLEWHEGTEAQATEVVQKDPDKCVLFFPQDVPGKGAPVNKEVSRSVFKKEPAIYGVCYYKGWSGYVFE